MNNKTYEKVIIGGGLFGLYAAVYAGGKGEHIAVLEYEDAPFKRATYCNQARVHLGYHYPRSYATAKKSFGYFERFNALYSDAIHLDFDKIYATSQHFSWTNGTQFQRFCDAVGIPCKPLMPQTFFNENMCDGTFETKEYTYDAMILKEMLLERLAELPNVDIIYNVRLGKIESDGRHYSVEDVAHMTCYTAPYVLNATYASVNQILNRLKLPPFKIKYELCEIIRCEVNKPLSRCGITVMDGPFFSIMPFGKTGLHSLTSVTFTPHMTSYETLPTFECQTLSEGYCSPEQLGNCNTCPVKPESAWRYMSNLAHKYLKSDFAFDYVDSLFAIKPILMASEIDDSRPTVVKVFTESPTFVSVLSGKINAVFDIEEVLNHV